MHTVEQLAEPLSATSRSRVSSSPAAEGGRSISTWRRRREACCASAKEKEELEFRFAGPGKAIEEQAALIRALQAKLGV